MIKKGGRFYHFYAIGLLPQKPIRLHIWAGVDSSKWNEKIAKLKKCSQTDFGTFYWLPLWVLRPWLTTQAHASAMCDEELGGIRWLTINPRFQDQVKLMRPLAITSVGCGTGYQAVTWTGVKRGQHVLESLLPTLSSLSAFFFQCHHSKPTGASVLFGLEASSCNVHQLSVWSRDPSLQVL